MYQACLAMADQEMDSALCQNPLPMLAAVIGVLTTTEEVPSLPEVEKEPVRQAIYFLAERLASLTALVDSSAPTVNFLQSVPRGSARAPARTLLHDVARGLARRVPLTKLVELDGDVRPYLASLMVAALQRANESLIIPQGVDVKRITQAEFDNMLAASAGQQYANYGAIAQQFLGDPAGAVLSEKELERKQRERVESLLETVAKVLPRLTGEGNWAGEQEGPDQRFGLGHSEGPKFQRPTNMDTNAVSHGEYHARIATAVVKVAERVE